MSTRRRKFGFIPIASVLVSGCVNSGPAGFRSATDVPRTKSTPSYPNVATNLTIAPILAISGKVVMSNPKARFVILSLAPALFPPGGTRLFAYRNGLKVAELKTSGTQWDDKTVADILSGDPQVNDLISDN